MSTLKTAKIINPSASSGGLTLATNGNVTGAGMDLIVSRTFSAAATVSVDNCWTAAYDNYRLMVRANVGTGNLGIRMRLRSAGVDATGANYTKQQLRGSVSTASAAQSTTDTGAMVGVADPSYGVMSADIFSPAKAEATGWFTVSVMQATPDLYVVSGFHTLTTAYDGLTLYPDSSTFTGTLRVYGYRN